MTIGERFAALLDARGIKQAALAAQYRERALARGREFAQETIESHISRLKKSEPVAVRFFFADLTDARDLLELLSVPEKEQDAYFRDANALLSPEERPVRLVVDLSDTAPGESLVQWGSDLADKVVLAIEERVALVVTESQRGYLLPRCTPPGRVEVVVVPDAVQGWSRTQELATEGAVVVSGRRHDPVTRWIALELVPQRLRMEPEAGVRRCAAGQPIDDAVADRDCFRLDRILGSIVPEQPPLPLTATPCAQRALLGKLLLGHPITSNESNYYGREQKPVDARTRAAWGAALGVAAVATEDQWAGLLVERAKTLGVAKIVEGDERALQSQRARVARGGEAPRGVRVGTELHLINAGEHVRAEMTGLHGVTFHDEAPRASAFTRLRELVARTPEEAWLDDPFLHDAIERIDPEGVDRDELDFARASLLLHGELTPPPAPCSREWRSTLAEILRDDPPPVGVRVPTTCTITVKDTADGWHVSSERDIQVTLLPASEVARRTSQHGVELWGVPAIVPPRVVRESALRALTKESDEPDRNDTDKRDAWWKQRRFLLPRGDVLKDLDGLFSLLDRSPLDRGYSGYAAGGGDFHAPSNLHRLCWSHRPVAMHPDFWREADEVLASLWIALRRAVLHADATTLHDGTGILEMGGGLVARIKVTHVRTGRDEHVEADFWREPRRSERLDPYNQLKVKVSVDDDLNARPTASIMHDVGTHVASTGGYRAQLLAEVPRRVFLAKGHARVTITFTATPWESFGERRNVPAYAAAVAGALHASDEARRRDDDE